MFWEEVEEVGWFVMVGGNGFNIKELGVDLIEEGYI